MAQPGFSKAELQARTEAMLRFTTSKAFLGELDAVLKTPAARQLTEASKRFSPEAIETLGLKTPDKTRISSRIFDEKSGRATVLGAKLENTLLINTAVPGKGPDLNSLGTMIDQKAVLARAVKNGWSVCVCVGAGICVGVGGGMD
jgi:hypothetical protein